MKTLALITMTLILTACGYESAPVAPEQSAQTESSKTSNPHHSTECGAWVYDRVGMEKRTCTTTDQDGNVVQVVTEHRDLRQTKCDIVGGSACNDKKDQPESDEEEQQEEQPEEGEMELVRCEVMNNIDCDGREIGLINMDVYTYIQGSQVVDVEVGFIWVAREHNTITEEQAVAKANDLISAINLRYQRNGVLVRLVLVAAEGAEYTPLTTGGKLITRGRQFGEQLKAEGTSVDLVILKGEAKEVNVRGTASFPRKNFDTPGIATFVGSAGLDTVIHEVGHAFGLSHGINHPGGDELGVVFKEFGHGYRGTGACQNQGSYMSYAGTRGVFSDHDHVSTGECTNGVKLYFDGYVTNEVQAINLVRYEMSQRGERYLQK